MKLKLSKKTIIIGSIVLAILIIGIVSFVIIKNGKKPNKDNTNKNETIKVEPESKKVKIVNEDSTSRPYAVMINNISVARRLQSGLQDAYIIYEIIVEGGISRYMALFMDQSTTRIGSIRSSRHYFLDYA